MTGVPERHRVAPNTEPDPFAFDEINAASSNAAADIARRFSVLIEEASKRQGLTREQRAAALYSLKVQRRTEAATARRTARDEEKEKRRPDSRQRGPAPPRNDKR